MNKFHKELNEVADSINGANFLMYEIAINRRHEEYFVDRYDNTGEYYGAIFVGSYKETLTFLRGMKNAYYYLKF